MNTITIEPAMESTVALWLKAQGGVAVWTNKDTISPGRGRQRFTPALTPEGAPWRTANPDYGNKPDFVVTDPASITVKCMREFKRVRIRQSTNPRGVSRVDQQNIDAAIRAAGNSATSRIDYSDPAALAPFCMAVIEVPVAPRPFNPEAKQP